MLTAFALSLTNIITGVIAVFSKEIRKKVAGYPDVVNMKQFMEILSAKGNTKSINWTLGKWILNERKIEHFVMHGSIMIPLGCIKEYVQSREYERDRLFFPSLCDDSLSFVISVDLDGRRMYYKRSYGKERKGCLTPDINKAYHYKYDQFARAVYRYEQMRNLIGDSKILKIDEKGDITDVQSDLCY